MNATLDALEDLMEYVAYRHMWSNRINGGMHAPVLSASVSWLIDKWAEREEEQSKILFADYEEEDVYYFLCKTVLTKCVSWEWDLKFHGGTISDEEMERRRKRKNESLAEWRFCVEFVDTHDNPQQKRADNMRRRSALFHIAECRYVRGEREKS